MPVRKFTVAEYHQLTDLGMLDNGVPVELLEGWIVPKMGKNPPHSAVMQLIIEVLGRLLLAGWRLRIQDPITTQDSEPEPDIAVVRGTSRTYINRNPGAKDIAMLIEVSDTSLDRDRGDKFRIYARASIGIYWIVNLVNSQVEVYTEPTGRRTQQPRYRRQTIYGVNDAVPLFIEGKEIGRIAVRDILP